MEIQTPRCERPVHAAAAAAAAFVPATAPHVARRAGALCPASCLQQHVAFTRTVNASSRVHGGAAVSGRSRSVKATSRAVTMGLSVESASDLSVIAPAIPDVSATARHLQMLGAVDDDNLRSLGITALVWFLTFWGLISFVKGSTKPRIEQHNYSVEGEPGAMARACAQHFASRAYKINAQADTRPGVVTFEGLVSPSYFIAGLLFSCLALGLGSLVVLLNTFLPDEYRSVYWWGITPVSALVVPWYWRGAERIEQVKLLIEEAETPGEPNTVYIKGHRDEIMEFERTLGYVRNEVPEQ
ncbi:Protein COFACTOR ASSEMBLY OF COMPLEX C SUBUNIT B CCB1, chloroplastic [Porphyridium purpureum]|uniref:Protein COFACTOR ASSEMBLY OF COMPLEX C SUBUNIT B CCB1, chloroplastic n=1 Tax=Porphyridium purpureum TaxID=35688 RepID=A0A5J4Z2N8_PORPP|nr:Protein COFACTOR ASSEMBLY OF COMPLEX C SUBUNIT B CCB1, chloroplastic [Porphyridium purpureum]|eukprot:POR6586..scf295_1